MHINKLHAYTAEFLTNLLDPKTRHYRGNANHHEDIEYRLKIFRSVLQLMLHYASTEAIPEPCDLITLCFPEFFFRGGPNGCYYADTDRPKQIKSQSLPYMARKKFAEDIARECQSILQDTFSEFIHSKQLAGVVICCGTVAIAKPFVSAYVTSYITSTGDDQPTVKTDNFAILIGLMFENQSWSKLIDKRQPSAIDYLECGRGPGQYIETSAKGSPSHKTFAIPISRALKTTHTSQYDLFISEETEGRSRASHELEPHYCVITSLPSPLNTARPLTIGASVCVDFQMGILGEEHQRKKYKEKIDILFVPSAGLEVNIGNAVSEAEEGAVLIHADGNTDMFSNVSICRHGVVLDPVWTLNFSVNYAKAQQIVESDSKNYYTFQPQYSQDVTKPMLVYRGFHKF